MTSDLSHYNKAQAFEAADDVPAHATLEHSLGAVISRRYGRRDILKGALAVPVATALFGHEALAAGGEVPAAPALSGGFNELSAGSDETHHVAEGYEAQILLRWGDPLFPGLAEFDPATLTPEEQAKRFGYNNDFLAFFPLDATGERGLLCVNHEYASPELMFPGVGRPDKNGFQGIDRAKVDVEIAAHGVSVVEIVREGGIWKADLAGGRNRRITGTTEMTADGPAAGHPRLKTAEDPSGLKILGTLNNCGGGVTPWGTYLTCEENFNGYFWSDEKDAVRSASEERYGIPSKWYNWGQHHPRFNVDKERNEANRFGWVVEIDPFDPASVPVKHTALGRFRHECADVHVNGDGRLVLYSGDDARFEYVYRYVSKDRFIAGDASRNRTLLSEGTLYAAKFGEDGTLTWLPLVHGEGPLTKDNGFESQADVLIDARLAAELLGATPMDRPEDVQTNPKTGKVYISLTNNDKRKAGETNAANPRPVSLFGHIIELTPPGGDHAAAGFKWDILVKCGDPAIASVGAMWGPETSQNGWFACPDNLAFDAKGGLWVASDQGENWVRTGRNDGLFTLETEGPRRGSSRLFFRVPRGAEMCGPCFHPAGDSLFLSVQHPGADANVGWWIFAGPPTYEHPATRWPDFKPNMPPRPSVVVVRRSGGGPIA